MRRSQPRPPSALTLELLDWVVERPRTYAETMAAWRTSCPRMPIWEDASSDLLLKLMAGDGEPGVAPEGDWQQISVFLSVVDVHVNRSPYSGEVVVSSYRKGSFLAAYRKESAHRNERSELWVRDGDRTVVFRQRAVFIKEQRADLVKHHLWVLWTDYFKPPHFEKYPQLHELFNKATKQAGAAGGKGSMDPAEGQKLLDYIAEIDKIFWETKQA